jgi:hypothetical protein
MMSDELAKYDPAELLAGQPKYPRREDTMKSVMDKFPGHITWASDRGSFSGNRVVTFMAGGAQGLEQEDAAIFIEQMKLAGLDIESSPEDVMNLYFSKRANLLVVDLTVSETTLTVLMTTQLDDDDLAELNERQVAVEIHMREWREKRAEAKAQEGLQIKENARLMEVGRNYEANISKKKLEIG